MAVPGPNQKHAEDITNTISVKIDDHVHFKPNIQLLSNKNQTSNSAVYSVLTNQNQTQSQAQTQTAYNSSAIFPTHVRQTDNLTSGLQPESNVHHNSSSINFNALPGTNQEDVTSSNNNIPVTYNTSQRLTQPPQIFSASINGANLLSSSGGDHNQLVSGSHSQEKNAESTVCSISNSSSQSYNHAMGLGSNLHIGLPTMTAGASDHSGSQQQSGQSTSTSQHQVSSSLSYIQPSSAPQYSHASSQIHYVQSTTGYQVSGGGLVAIDTQQGSGGHQPTYVLLQAPGDGESGAPQVFLAMQTTSLSGQDGSSQPYITLQPVSVDGTDLSNNTLVQEGVNLQQAVMGGDMNSDGKSLVSEGGQQVVLSIPGQQTLLPSSANNGQPSLVTYLQPLGSIGVPVSNMEQGQVIMAASDMQGNLTLHNVPTMGTGNKRSILASSRQPTQVGLTTPRRRLSQDPRSCVQCGRCFKYPSDLKKHLQIHTDIKKFACDDCPRTFRRLHQLNVHRRIHTGEKPYVCNRCGAQFRHDSTLTMHIRTRHDHLKPFTCDGCSKKFGRMSHLRKHQRNVCGRSGLRGSLAQCKYCEASFTKKADLKGHFNVCEKKPDRVDKDVMNPSPYPCETCGKEFSRVYDFKRHQLSHSDEKPYGCPQCGKTFKERSSLNKHVKRMHCSDGDGTIPIDDDGIIAGDDDDEDELSGDEHDPRDALSCLSDGTHTVSQISTAGVSAEALAQAGIITSRHEVMTAHGQTISAAEILNFPEVAEALGINSGAHATVLDSDGHSTMIAITQPGNLETTEVSMDMEQNIIQDGSIIVTENHDAHTEQYISASDALQMNPVQVVSDSIDHSDHIHVVYSEDNTESVIYHSPSGSFHSESLGSTMVFKQEDEEHYLKREEDLSDHVKAEQAAAHDLQPEDEQTIIPNHMLQEE